MMSNKINLRIFAAIGLAAALLATVSVLPFLKYAVAVQQNATTMSQTDETMMMTEDMIKAKADQLKSKYPLLASVLSKIQSMDSAQTLKTLIGLHIVERLLEAHAGHILLFENFTMNPTLG